MISETEHKAFAQAIESGDLAKIEDQLRLTPGLVNHSSWTPPPLHCAILWNQPEVAALLLGKGADIEQLDPDRQTTPLRYAIMFAKVELVTLLLSRGACTDPIVPGGLSALALAQSAARGDYAEFDDLPSPEDYNPVVLLLERAGL